MEAERVKYRKTGEPTSRQTEWKGKGKHEIIRLCPFLMMSDPRYDFHTKGRGASPHSQADGGAALQESMVTGVQPRAYACFIASFHLTCALPTVSIFMLCRKWVCVCCLPNVVLICY